MMRKMFILVSLLLVIVPLCEQALISFTKYYGNGTTWYKAQAICKTHHTDLVTIRNEEENQQLYGFKGWIGLHREDDNSPWKWSRGDKKANFTLWDSDEPDPGQHCAFKRPSGNEWRSTFCDKTRNFTCYDELLVLVKEKKTWEEALEHCRSLGGEDTSRDHHYDLVTLTSGFDHSYARSEAQEATTDEVWTGLRFLAGEWLWVSGEQVNYNIPSCEADRFCGVLEKSGTSSFGIRSCNERRNFFCLKRLQTSESMQLNTITQVL